MDNDADHRLSALRAQNPDTGWVAPVPYAIHTTVRVWLVIRSLSFLPDWPRTQRFPNGPVAYADACRGYSRLPLSHYPRRPNRATAHAHRPSHFDLCCL